VDEAGDVPENRQSGRVLPWVLLLVMVVAVGFGFAVLAVLRHRAFQSHAFDLGNMDQAVWSTLHGHPLRFTDMDVGGRVLTNRLAIHVEPLLIVMAPLYLLHDGPETLLVAQALVVASGAVPAYLIARTALGRPHLALVFPAAYLLHPTLQNAMLDDFHAVAMSACFLLWALFFAYQGHVRGFLVAGLLAASTKEEIGLLVATVSLLLALKKWRMGILGFALGCGWFVCCMTVIVPHFNPGGHSPYLERYAYLGHGLTGIMEGIVRNPHLTWTVLTSPARLDYLAALMHPLGWTSLLALPLLALAAPSFAINMLSADPTMYSGLYQYSAEVIPFVIASSAIGIRVVTLPALRHDMRQGWWIVTTLCVLALAASFLDDRRYGFSPLAEGFSVPSVGPHQRLEDRFLRAIPSGAVVSASDEIEPHLSHRTWIYLLPTLHPRNGPVPEYVVLDASIASLPTTPRTLHRSALEALGHGYGIVAGRDGLLLLRRGAVARRFPAHFLDFALHAHPGLNAANATWGALRLVNFTVHPRDDFLSRSRPAIQVEMNWRPRTTVPASVRIEVWCSPVYTGTHPRFSRRWQVVDDSPTWDWLPVRSWPRGRTIHAAALPLLPNVDAQGEVDVAISVSRAGPLRGVAAGSRVAGNSRMTRIASLSVGY